MRTVEHLVTDLAASRWGAPTRLKLAAKLCEEAGEVAGVLVRLEEGEGRATAEDLGREVGDLLVVASQIAHLLGATLEELRAERVGALRRRVEGGAS